MEVKINTIPRPSTINQTSDQENRAKVKHASYSSDLWISWGIVEQANSGNNTIDVRIEQRGWILRKVPVRSLEWAGANTDRGFGERDLPPKDSKVLIVFTDGIIDNAFALCSVLLTVGDTGTKLKQELLASGKEREYLRIKEKGWKQKYDKDSGDLIIENSKTGTDKIKIIIKNSTGEASIESKGAKMEITNSGAINVTPATGQSIILNNGTRGANDFPLCLFSGANHCLDILQTVKVP